MHSIIIKILWFCFSKIPIIRFRPRSRLSITFQTMINVFWKLVFIYINGMCWQLYIQVHFPKTSLRLRLQITSNTKKSKQKIRCELRKWIFSWIVFIEFLERNKKSAHRIDWNINIQKGSGRSTIQFNCNMSDLLISNMSELNKLKIARYWIMNENNDTNVSRQIALKYKKKNNQKTETNWAEKKFYGRHNESTNQITLVSIRWTPASLFSPMNWVLKKHVPQL